MKLARAILIACALLLAAGTGAVRPAAAATPCWTQLLNDWYDGRIDKTYPVSCYQSALGHLPTDVQIYSSARDDLQRALASAIQREKKGDKGGGTAPPGGSTTTPTTTTGPDGTDTTTTPPAGTTPATEAGGRQTKNGPFGVALDKLNPGKADSLPIPLLILGGLAILLVAAGVAGMLVRRNQA